MPSTARAAASAALPPAPVGGPPPPLDSGWQRALGAWLAAHKTYPDEARRRGEEGRLVIRFTVARSGDVSGVVLVHGSGSMRLDEAAQAMLRGARVPALTAGMPQDGVTVSVTIRYALEP